MLPKSHDEVKVSVVMCTYNGAAFLNEQLDSIVKQTYPLHEIIVVDDGSQDETMVKLQAWSSKYPLIRVYQNQQNFGYNRNFEKGLSLASGDVVAISDQDDIWHLQKIENLMEQWPLESPLIYCQSVLFRNTVPDDPQPPSLIRMIEGKDPRQLALYNTVSGHAMLVRRSLLQLAMPFHPDVYYDWWLAVVAAANGGIIFHPSVLVYQRVHTHNATFSENESNRTAFSKRMNQVCTNARQFSLAPNLSAADKDFFKTLGSLWQQRLEGKNKSDLFFFLLKHRDAIYYSKRRKLAFITQLKRSYRYAFG